MATIPDFFIIESLNPDDEGNGRFEGSSISHVLRLHGKNPKYRYVRTRKQFIKALKEFDKSRYRYLHISAHADEDGMCTTNQDEIHYTDLAKLLKPCMAGRRLFLSACAMVHEKMAKAIIPETQCVSIIGPKEVVSFCDAAVLWPAIYHLMFTNRDDAMSHDALKTVLKSTVDLFKVNLVYFSRSKKLKRGYTVDFLNRAK